ncbi:hypothetical protein C8J57DRAFT_1355452 [Mycena rebaudengoi]|nr:hypothetical protein C8J57DRAFT_1355452 [Mycena rebaudengoi]
MLFRLCALALTAISLAAGASAVNCGVCAPSIVYAGLVRTLTLQREEGSNTVQCNYDTPPISGFSPACLYRVYSLRLQYTPRILNYPQNVDGHIIFTNTGPTLTSLPGACPAVLTLVSKPSC